ncbi:MAG: FadR family transcriptional regulator [Planctomycetota bacterium]|nr:FadR family transcriptional regulator [Planctomycetota bacterium]
MTDKNALDFFHSVEIVRPADQVVRQIRLLIAQGSFQPGDLLPPERLLSAKLGVSRGHIRAGIKMLELYGIVKSVQGRGTLVTDIGTQTMNGMLVNLLKLTSNDIMSFADTRILLETHAAGLAAKNGTREEHEILRNLVDRMRSIDGNKERWLEVDLGLHIGIANASHNTVLAELIKFMAPNIMGYYRKFFRDRIVITIPIHRKIVDCIVKGDSEKAAKTMQSHLMNSRKTFAASLGSVKI